VESLLGRDMESGLFQAELARLVRAGRIARAKVDDAVRRILRFKAALGLFERPYAAGDDPGIPLPAASRALAQTAAEESFVLLQNAPVHAKAVLPLDCRRGRTLALIGALADSPADMLGPWSGRGSSSDVTTLRTALADRAAVLGMSLHYAKGTDLVGQGTAGIAQAVATAKLADVVVVALGEHGEWTGEGASRAHLDLGVDQQTLLEDIVATGKSVVLVLFNGRPLTIDWAQRHVAAIVEAWFPGVAAGPALTRLLCGDVVPSGHLTASFPRAVGQDPLYYNALPTGRPLPAPATPSPTVEPAAVTRFVSRYIDELNPPLFPFGHGLSYTTFSYSTPVVNRKTIRAATISRRGDKLAATGTVTNVGGRAGTTVVQCYVRRRGTSVARPVRELVGFRRVALEPGQSVQVQFDHGQAELAFWNLAMKPVVEPCRLEVWIAPESVSGGPATVSIVK
jgi:beta-glucosidase